MPNGDGWLLALYQTFDPDKRDPRLRPVLIVPGYGMNSFIFSYHPSGHSLEGFLVEAGFEVWRVDLRAQGDARATDGSRGNNESFGLGDLAMTDLRCAIAAVRERTNPTCDGVDVIGASLGGTILLTYAVLSAMHGQASGLGSLVILGTPIRWVEIHPVLRVAFASPFLVGLVRVRNARALAARVLPLLARHTPWLLSVYLNPGITDTSAASELVRTVEDPSRRINRQIAHWVRARDLVIRGVNVAANLARVTQPLLCVTANRDGIVPGPTARFPYEQVGSREKQLLEIGSDDLGHAHADLFISSGVQDRVFRPIADWLRRQVC